MSKELIERLREAAASRVASTAMIGADDLIAAADALEQTEAARMAAISRLCEAEVACAVACQERDALVGLRGCNRRHGGMRAVEPCGYRMRTTDPGCTGCVERDEDQPAEANHEND